MTSSPGGGDRLDILMLTDYFPPFSSGGVERAVLEIGKRMVQAGHAVTVLTLRLRKGVGDGEMEGMQVIRVPGLDLSGRLGAQVAVSAQAWPAIRGRLRTGQFDIVHTHNIFFHVSLAASVLAPIAKVPLVTTAHLGSPEDLGGVVSKATGLYEKTLGRRILNASARSIGVSQAVVDHLRPLLKRPQSMTAIPNGVDLERFRPRQGDGVVTPPTVLFVGRLIFNKGPQFFLEAIPAVLARYPETRFHFIGDGPMSDDLQRRARELGVQERVEFLGQREDVAELLRQGSMLVRPSLSEGLPLVALEGMASGLPVIATRVGGTAEVVEDGVTGFVLNPNEMGLVADRINRLLADPGLSRQMGARGRALTEKGHDWTAIAERTIEVYREALGAGAGATRS